MISYPQFMSNAAEYVDTKSIPSYVCKAAYATYNKLPTKSASAIMKAYEVSKTANEKYAFELIGANIVKEAAIKKKAFAPLLATAGRALLHPITQVGMQVGGVAMDSINKNRSTVKNNGIERVGMPNVSQH